MWLVWFLIFLALSGPALTLYNLGTLIFQRRRPGWFEPAAFSLGMFSMVLLYWMFWSSGTWLGFDAPVSEKHMLTVVVLFAVGVLSYGYLKKRKEQMSPLTKVLAMGGIYIGIIISFLIVIQLSARYSEPLLRCALPYDAVLMALVPLNYVALAVVELARTVHMQHMQLKMAEGFVESPFVNGFLRKFNSMLGRSRHWILWAFLLMLLLFCVTVIVLLLFEQKPDSFIRAFTETRDWTLSAKIFLP